MSDNTANVAIALGFLAAAVVLVVTGYGEFALLLGVIIWVVVA